MTVSPLASEGPGGGDVRQPTERQRSYIAHVGLNPEQGQTLIEVSNRYREYLRDTNERAVEIAGIASPTNKPSPKESAQLRVIAKERSRYLRGFIVWLHSRLDDQGDRIVQNDIDSKVMPRIRFQ